jgi:tRNA/rRNA methyltransferase
MTKGADLGRVTIVLHRPRYPENIGSAARVVRNMGIGALAVVAPENCDLEKVTKLATHSALDVVEQMAVFANLDEALAPFGYVVGTTARRGGERQMVMSPATMAGKVVPIARHNPVAIVFGPEDRGLTNKELRRCHELVTIPTADFASLNLAQAVMVIAYSLFAATIEPSAAFAPRLATRHELDGMYNQLRDILVRISYINPENPDYWMNRLRRFFTRLQLQAADVSMIRGICRQINWYAGKRYSQGWAEALAAGAAENDGAETDERKTAALGPDDKHEAV